MIKLKCLKCKHEWLPRVSQPLECPHCKSRDWESKDKNSKEEIKQKEEAF